MNSACLGSREDSAPMLIGFDSRARRYNAWSLLLVLGLGPRGFSPGTTVFPSPQKPPISNSNSIWRVSPVTAVRLIHWHLNKVIYFFYFAVVFEVIFWGFQRQKLGFHVIYLSFTWSELYVYPPANVTDIQTNSFNTAAHVFVFTNCRNL